MYIQMWRLGLNWTVVDDDEEEEEEEGKDEINQTGETCLYILL